MFRKSLYFFALLFLVGFLYLAFEFYTYTQAQNQQVYEQGQQTTEMLRSQVNEILVKISSEGKRLAELFGNNEYTKEQIENMIRESALSIPEIQGVTACFEPFALSKEERLYCPYYNKATQNYIYVEDNYDYSIVGAEGTAWYTRVRDEGAKWVEPYYGQAAQDWFVDYGIPFYYGSGPNKGKVRGTITMSFVCSGFMRIVHSLSLGKTGYGIISSTEGVFLAHPVNEYIGNKNLKETIAESSNRQLTDAYKRLLAGEKGNISFYDSQYQEETLFFYDQIPSSGWGIGLQFVKKDLMKDPLAINRRYIRLALTFSFFLIFVIAIYYNKDYLDRQEIWRLSIIASLLLIANIFLVGYLQHSTSRILEAKESPPITDIASLSQFVQKQKLKADELKVPRPVPVPTGFYIHRMEFGDSYNLNIGATIWQKYPLDIADQVEIGFTLPQMSPFAEASYIEEAYRDTIAPKEGEPGYLLIGWDVRSTLRLNFRYSEFPLDKQHINIKIQPINNQDHLIFTPDLVSYTYTNPTRKSGISDEIQIPGSEFLQSYFNYSLDSYDADFGYGSKALFEEVPILHYNIYLRRLLLNAFVTYLIPIFVTLVMVFILIYACGKTEERQGIIESMAAFFFVLIFSHIDLRKEIVTADLIYIEYFYFITYLMLVLSTFNLITYAKDKSAVFDFNDNQVFKALYFPLFFLLILGITLFKFY